MIGSGVLDDLDFEMVETAARQVALRVMGRAVAARLNSDRRDEKGPRHPCDCGEDARYAGRRGKVFVTALGPITLARAWYHCACCNRGFSPRDRALGLEDTTLSPAVPRMTGVTAARVSFAESGELLRELAGLDIDPKTVERHAETLGRAIAADEYRTIAPEPADAGTLYAGLDGTGVPVRKSETKDRKGKQPDGSAKTREAKIIAIWSAETRNKDGLPVRDPESVTYNAAIETIAGRDTDTEPAPFAARALREVHRRGFHQAPRQVVLGDGAARIWNWADEYAPDAIQIVDIYHVKQHLFDVSKAIYGTGTDLAGRWGKERRDELDQGHLNDLLAALGAHDSCEEARKCIDYITHNRARMQYPTFRGMGLCIATGVIEGACKNIVGSRLKRGGMHWTVDGANAIIALRCSILSNRSDDFWERRASGE